MRLSAMLLMLAATPAWAAFCSANQPPAEPRHDFQFFGGYSPVSATLIGTTQDRRLVVAGFSYSYRAGATGLNFLIDEGGGVRIKVAPRRAISLGYKFLHISNGFTSAFNPGADNNVFYAGFSLLR